MMSFSTIDMPKRNKTCDPEFCRTGLILLLTKHLELESIFKLSNSSALLFSFQIESYMNKQIFSLVLFQW